METLKPNEIRIGNYIKIFNIVTQIEGYCIWDNVVQSSQFAERTLDEFEAEPLTEEWLLKFGFIKSENILKFFLYNNFEVYIQDNVFWYDLTNDSIVIENVHQLQNLYFTLTGKELTIKEVN